MHPSSHDYRQLSSIEKQLYDCMLPPLCVNNLMGHLDLFCVRTLYVLGSFKANSSCEVADEYKKVQNNHYNKHQSWPKALWIRK